MQTGYFIAIATATLWAAVLAAPTTPAAQKNPGPEEAHKRMPKIVAAYEDLREKFQNLKRIMNEIKEVGYKPFSADETSDEKKAPAKKKDTFEDLVSFPEDTQPSDAKPDAAKSTSIDDAPVEHHMSPSERMKLLSKKFHATHTGRGSMVHEAVGAKASPSPDSSPSSSPSSVPSLANALNSLKNSLKETMMNETPVSNPNTKKDDIDIAEKMRAKLKVQNRLQKFREQMARNRVHRVGEILPPVILDRSRYRRIKRRAQLRRVKRYLMSCRRRYDGTMNPCPRTNFKGW